MTFFISDPKTKEPSVTLTLLIYGFLVCTLKLLGSGLEIHGLKLAVFGGGDYAAAVGALGALYWARRNASTGDKPDASS